MAVSGRACACHRYGAVVDFETVDSSGINLRNYNLIFPLLNSLIFCSSYLYRITKHHRLQAPKKPSAWIATSDIVRQRIFSLKDINLSSSAVLLSDGTDSRACLQFMLDRHHDVSALFIDYGEAAAEHERLATGAVAKHFDVHLSTIGVTGGRSFSNGELPGRNASLITTALFFGSQQQNFISIGIHAGTPYYDCSQDRLSRTLLCLTRAESCRDGICGAVGDFGILGL
jgi:hypothetical protein